MMMRATSRIARDLGFMALVTGESINTVEIQLITELIDDISVHSGEVVIVDHIDPTATIIDIRHPHEVEQKLLAGNDLTATVLMIPFYAFSTR